MNQRFYIIVILLTLGAFASPTLGIPFLEDREDTATVQGGIYLESTFQLLNDTVVDINSTPPQNMVAKDGRYSFELVPGDYTITARHYQNDTLVYSREATFQIEVKGDYIRDLLLVPVSETPVTGENLAKNNYNSVNLADQIKTDFSTDSSTDSSTKRYLLIVPTLFLLLGGVYKLSRRYQKLEKNMQEGNFNISGFLVKLLGKSIISEVKPGSGTIEEAVSVKKSIVEHPDIFDEIETIALKKLPLSTELQEIMGIIRGHKGRITQKDLRSKLNYSEVKVSMLLSELEKRGLIQKVKKGRENIVVLIDEDTKTH